MRIKNIHVEKLFNVFNHSIPLKLNDRITIIHGPNGYGKTIILRMLEELFSSRYTILRKIPYKYFIVTFEDDSSIKIEKVAKDNETKRKTIKPELHFIYSVPGEDTQEYTSAKMMLKDHVHFPLGIISQNIPTLERVEHSLWHYSLTDELLNLEEVVDRFSDQLPINVSSASKEPDWFKKVRRSINIRLIEAQRLLNLQMQSPRVQRSFEDRPSMVPAVATYSAELARSIQKNLAEYAALSQSLDRTFPSRILGKSASPSLRTDELRKRFTELENKRVQLMDTGLLDVTQAGDFQLPSTSIEKQKNVLSIYVDDVEKKLKVLDSIAEKIQLLLKIINERFLFKHMSVDKEKGFIFTTKDKNTVPPTDLSSGEQHELILLYELLFKVKPKSMILIDEPELSLHIRWQKEFLRDIQKIIELADIDVLVATHSPQIINKRWDVTVELQGPVE